MFIYANPDDYDYDYPVAPEHDSETLDDLSILFEEGFEDVPFTAAEEEMLPEDISLV